MDDLSLSQDMGAVACCEYGDKNERNPNTMMSSVEFKEALEGDSRQMREKPEVWIIIVEIILKEDGATSFSPSKFSLTGLRARCRVEMRGTHVQMVQELGQETALKIMDKVGISQKLSLTRKEANEVFGKIQGGAADGKNKLLGDQKTSLIEVKERAPLQDRIGSGKGEWDRGQQDKVFEITASFNVTRELGEEEVTIDLHEVEIQAENKKTRSILMSENLNKHIADALSKKATMVIAEKAIAISGSAAPAPKR